MLNLRVVTWNAEGMFAEGTKTTRATPLDAIRVLKKLNADIVVIPEFGSSLSLHDETLRALKDLSYECIITKYMDERTPDLNFAILSRLPVTHYKTYTLSGSMRHALLVECRLPDTRLLQVLGVHLDDMTEAIRIQQIVSVVDVVKKYLDTPLLVMGDFNAMSRQSLFARFVNSRLIRLLANIIPHTQLRSISSRVSEMGNGSTIEYLLSHTSLRSLDTGLQRTISAKQAGLEWMPSWRIGKIDWIFGNSLVCVRSYTVTKDVGSDHRPVVADLTLV